VAQLFSLGGFTLIVVVWPVVWMFHFPRELFRASSASVLCCRAYRVAGVGFRIHIFYASTTDDAEARLEEFIQLHRLVAS